MKKEEPAPSVKEEPAENPAATVNTPTSRKRASNKPSEEKAETETVVKKETILAKKPVKKARKTKEEKELDAMPLAPRSQGLKMFVGAHVSAAKGKWA